MESIKTVTSELDRTLSGISPEEQTHLADMILEAKRIYVVGVGRSGLMARCFTMRLMHMGFEVYFVGEVVTPFFREGDLLIVTSGSGTTGSLVTMSEKAKKIGGKVALITIYPESTIAKLADMVVTINAPTSKGAKLDGITSVQPMGSLFEQSLLICLDYVVLILMDKKQITGEEMFLRHANLE